MPGRDIYMDDGFSGGNMDRPALQKLLFDARNKMFDLVMVYKQDRLSRRLKDLLGILEELDILSVGYKSATEPFDTTSSAGKMAIQMLGSCAEFERNRLVERIFPGMIIGVKKGHWPGARYAPYGYRYNKAIKKLELHAEEAKTVKQIFAMYLSGKSTSQICAHYYALGVTSRMGGKFYNKFLTTILRSKVYLGMIVWNRRRYNTKIKTKDGFGKHYKYINNDPSQIIETPNAHEAIISQKDYDDVQMLLSRNRTNSKVKFKNTPYHLSGIIKCKECGSNYRGVMIASNRTKGIKKAWYRCASVGLPYIQCNNGSLTEEAVNRVVWDIIDVIFKNTHVIEELSDAIKLNASEPEQVYIDQLAVKETLIKKNLDKQKGLYELFSEDKINLELYKNKAESLRQEEKRLKQDIRDIQVNILNKRNSVNVIRAAEDFLLRLRSNASGSDHMNFLVKTFMRIIFRNIYVKDREIVTFELNEPWKTCYEEGTKWLKTSEIEKIPQGTTAGNSAYCWLPTDAK